MYKLITGNCKEKLKRLDNNSIDLTATSPPYDEMRDYNGYSFEFEPIAEELYRVTKQGGVVVWVVRDQVINGSESGTSFRQALYFMKIGFNLHDTMIYQKASMAFPSSIRYHQIFDYMFVLSKGKPKTVNLIKDRKNKCAGMYATYRERQVNETIKKNKKRKKIKEYGTRFNIWRYDNGFNKNTTDTYCYQHPALMPEKLAEDHILSWSNEGDIVLDPMCGASTTGKMAVLNNRYFIGMEISKEYLLIAKRRMKVFCPSNSKSNVLDHIFVNNIKAA